MPERIPESDRGFLLLVFTGAAEQPCQGFSDSHRDVDGLHAQTICCRDGKFRRLLAHIGYVFQFLHGVLVDGTVFVVAVIV